MLLKSAAVILVLTVAGPAAAQANKPIPIVATFSILGDMVERIGGEHVAVATLVGPDGDAHVYRPTPADARAVNKAKVLVVNGLEFEGWLDRLIDASDFNGIRVKATDGIEPIAFEEGDGHAKHDDDEKHKDHGKQDEQAKDDHHSAFDPHAWQSLSNAVVYVDNITATLSKADPSNAATYYMNRAAYVAEIQALDAEIRAIVAKLPANRRTVVTSHDAFQYFGRDYGLTFLAPHGLSTESAVSAKDIGHLIEQIREQKIPAVFVENISDPRLLKQIANETRAAIGGTLYPGALSAPNGPAHTYLRMMRHNAMALAQALGS
jgi:zinc/manganese transport system substrate-binding protein